MEMFELVLLMLVLIGVSNVLNRFIPTVPVPLFQIILGALAAIMPLGLHLPLNTELFLLLFIAPLLYNDGKKTPREELWNLRSPILLLALGLVFVTVFAGGYFIHWLIPSIPLPAAFALAAILSPTDAVAVSSLAGRIHLPKGILRLLEGESLMNDASGLVAFKFAVAATVTGVFSLADATVSFLWIALGGLLCGAVLAFLIVWVRMFIRRLGMEDVTVHMLIQILTPFLIYLITEELGLSGILAVVAGGIVHAIERDRNESVQAELRVVSQNTWTVILYILNGLVFVILGLEIPSATQTIFHNPEYSNLQVLGFIGLIYLGLLLLRFIWVYVFWRGSWLMGSGEDLERPKLMSSLLISLSGVRGAVTLAAAFSIPFLLQDGSAFPERDLIIFLAAGVILCSLVVASVLLPLLSREQTDEVDHSAEREHEARLRMLKAGIRAVEGAVNEENGRAAREVISNYRRQLYQLQQSQNTEDWSDRSRNESIMKIRFAAIQAERQELQKMLEQGEVSGELAGQIQEVMSQMEVVLSSGFKMKAMVTLFRLQRLFKGQLSVKKREQIPMDKKEKFASIRLRTASAALAVVKSQMNDTNRQAVMIVASQYQDMVDRLRSGVKSGQHMDDTNEDMFDQFKNELQIKAIQAERDEVQLIFEEGGITRATANKLRQYINYTEAGILEPGEEE
ncbi:sodium, potassium, lithium and rubidium/H(+) antiporter [Paenibacillus antibioticophila]|uniref:Sodium, potassium, lithium and rubidium/H(+) antiporter n=1 Tax=Paenibacillus antibioticophila TaxID=1274374 RepID=A0A919XR91_9BACL|nr:Na+/H+ antiporter [Paenibacillus antibioticophila]GIO35272.1 sodium, potassium, lithium and rubidium/H(+) antiporter [Paenibacillus antibioticophila]